MSDRSNSSSTIYVGNLDERVSDRVLYDILIQAGRVVDLHIPRDKDTDKPKGFAFAEYESQEVAEYAVKLFSGLVTLHKRTLRFAISGRDKPAVTLPIAASTTINSSPKPRSYNNPHNDTDFSPPSSRISTSHRLSDLNMNYAQAPVSSDISMHQPNGYRSYRDSSDYDYSRRVLGSSLDSVSRSRSGRYDTRNPMNYNPSY